MGHGTKEDLKRMTDSILHRGPDGEGFFVSGNVHLGVRRLAIIDLAGGNQPLFNEDHTIVVVYNGEIYNYRELREVLARQGHRFATQSDTEVIAHGYEEWGTEVVIQLNGMFAIALYDTKKNQLFLARDRLGKKPLYYSLQGGTLFFASELKALAAHQGFEKRISEEAFRQYLAYDYVPSPSGIWQGVSKLLPGEYATFENGEVKKEIYWKPSFAIQGISFRDAKARLDALLADAVARRLIADVPLGVFLSGSIDSSTIAYYAAQASEQPIKTFTIGFEDRAYDESPFAGEVARMLGSRHTPLIVRQTDFLGIVDELADLADEPLADPSLIPTYFLAKLTREHVTVALGGDGADEVLAGYQTFIAYAWQRKLGILLPTFNQIAHVAAEISRQRPEAGGYFSIDYNLQKYADGLGLPLHLENQNWLASFTMKDIDNLVETRFIASLPKEKLYQSTIALANEAKSGGCQSGFQFLAYLYLKQYLADQVMVKVDRASMANSLEARAPFLDYRVVEFLLSVPDTYKIRFGLNPPYFVRQKYILRQLMKKRLPKPAFRSKHGFAIPLAAWLRKELKPLVLDLLSAEALAREGRFNPAFVERILKEHFAFRANHAKKIWNLVVWELWRKRWGA